MQLNRANFLTWYDSNDGNELPIHSQDGCGHGLVFWEWGDTMSFVLNTDGGIPVGLTPTLEIRNKDNTVLATFNLLSYTSDLINGFKLYGSFTCPELPIGLYNLRIINSSLIYISQPVFICQSSFARAYTAKFKFRHKFDKNDIGYANGLTTSFYQEFRLMCTFAQNETQTEKDIVIDMDSPTPREYNHKVQHNRRGALYNLDVNMHQAAADMLSSSELFVNGRRYQSQGDYAATPLRRNGTSNGEFTISDYALRHLKRS